MATKKIDHKELGFNLPKGFSLEVNGRLGLVDLKNRCERVVAWVPEGRLAAEKDWLTKRAQEAANA